MTGSISLAVEQWVFQCQQLADAGLSPRTVTADGVRKRVHI